MSTKPGVLPIGLNFSSVVYAKENFGPKPCLRDQMKKMRLSPIQRLFRLIIMWAGNIFYRITSTVTIDNPEQGLDLFKEPFHFPLGIAFLDGFSFIV